MPLTRDQKALLIDEISEQLEGVPTIYVTDFKGLSVAESNDLRNQFREAGVEFRVVKNTLLRMALERLGGYDDLIEHLSGPSAVAISDEPAAPARVIKQFVKDAGTDQPTLKAAYIDGDLYGGDQLDVLAALKSRDELLGDVIGLLLSPATNIVGALEAQGQNLVGAIKAIAEGDEA
jgi:large subunit ribosomal protein L10